MSYTPRVAAVAGSLRAEITTRVAVEHALAAAAAAGAEVDLIDLREHDLPLYDADDRDAGDTPELRRRVREADAVILGSPIYHGTIASPLKTLLDYCGFDEFEDTLVGIVVTAGGRFPTPAILHLRTAARWVRAWVHPTHVGVPDASDAIEGEEVVDESVADRLETLGEEMVDYAAIGRLPELTERVLADTTGEGESEGEDGSEGEVRAVCDD
jgi:NAD(P)H-dependent FMN reductase